MRGFSLLEAIVSVAILAGAVLALTSAMLGSTHDTSTMISRQTLTDVASDVLTDLRVSSAYQPEVMDALYANPPQPFTVTRASAVGAPIAIRVSERLTPLANAPGYDVTVVATAPDGHGETLRATVMQQAVAPGSTVTQAPIGTAATPNAIGPFGAFSPATAAPAAAACLGDGVCWPHGREEPSGSE